MKLTAVEKCKLDIAYREASDVLRHMKLRKLNGTALRRMKELELAVQALEFVKIF